MTQPAVCELDDCGVLAIGRCETCRRAFCTTHRAIDMSRRGVPLINMCVSCYDKTPEGVHRKEQYALDKEIKDFKKYIESGSAHNDLLKKGVKQIDLYNIDAGEDVDWTDSSLDQDIVLEKIFRRGIVKKIGQCWYLGELLWGYNSELVKPTALFNRTIRIVQPFESGYRVLTRDEHDLSLGWDDWIKVKRAVMRLVEM